MLFYFLNSLIRNLYNKCGLLLTGYDQGQLIKLCPFIQDRDMTSQVIKRYISIFFMLPFLLYKEKKIWQTITGVNFGQLDSWLTSIIGEDGQVCLPFELNDVSPVDGLKFTDFKAVEKKLAKLRMNKIPSSTVMMHMTEQIRNQYGQRKNQEFDQVLLLKVGSFL